MSLKAIHVVFIAASFLLTLGFGVWALREYSQNPERLNLAMGVGSLLVSAGLLVYGRYFLKKFKNISYL